MIKPPKSQRAEEGRALNGLHGLLGPPNNRYNSKYCGEGMPISLFYYRDMKVGALSTGRRTVTAVEPSNWKCAMPGESGYLTRLYTMPYDILEEVSMHPLRKCLSLTLAADSGVPRTERPIPPFVGRHFLGQDAGKRRQ